MTEHTPISLHHRETTLSWSSPPDVGPWTLRGTSRSAHATAWYIPELGVAVDAGAVVYTNRPDHLFITHTHADHVFRLPTHATGLVDRYLHAAQALTDSREPEPGFVWTRAYDLNGVVPGDAFVINRGRMRADVIGCDHSVPCMGYIFSLLRNKLKAELVGLSGPEIGALRKTGTCVMQEQAIPSVAFLGDTTPEVYTTHPELLNTMVIIG